VSPRASCNEETPTAPAEIDLMQSALAAISHAFANTNRSYNHHITISGNSSGSGSETGDGFAVRVY